MGLITVQIVHQLAQY